MMLPKQWRVLLSTAVVLWCLPLFTGNDYLLLLGNVVALNAMVVLGLNLLIASTGQVSLGHAAFYGLGAYLSAIASATWHWPLVAALPFAVATVAAIAFLLACVVATIGIGEFFEVVRRFECFAPVPEAEWVSRAAEELSQIDELVTGIHAGPLGMTLRASDAGKPLGRDRSNGW